MSLETEHPTVTDERIFFRQGRAGSRADTDPGESAVPYYRKRGRGRRYRARVLLRRFVGRARSALAAALAYESAIGTPFLFVPVAFAAGAVSYFGMAREPSVTALFLGLAVLCAFLSLARNGPRIAVIAAAAAALVVAGIAVAQFHSRAVSGDMLGSAVTTRLTGRIVAIEERANGRTRFTIDVVATERPRLRYAPDRVRVTAPNANDELEIGGGIRGLVRLMPVSGPFHPGGYDFTLHAYFDGYGANGFFLGEPEAAALPAGTSGMPEPALLIERMRQAIAAEIAEATGGRGGAVAITLITGNKSVIPADVTEALRISGLAHILSISGLHMALVAVTVMASLRAVFALTPNWSARRPVKKYAAAAALAATGFYLFLAGASVATQRSFIMLAIMLMALSFDRSAVTMRNLAIAAIVVIAIAPHEVSGPGFQMSFAATAALIAVYSTWQDIRSAGRRRDLSGDSPGLVRRIGSAVLVFFAGLAVTSLVAGIATGIFASYHFGRVAPYGLIANLAAMPIVSLLVMPLAVVSMLAMPFGLHAFPLRAMAWSAEQVIRIAEWVAGMSPPVATGQMPDAALVMFALALVFACLFSTILRLVSLPFLVAGVAFWHGAERPVAVVSEDARQVAVIENGETGIRLHANRARPNRFTLDMWTGAYGAAAVVTPRASDVFECGEDGFCAATVPGTGGKRLAYLSNPGQDDDTHIAHKAWADMQADACKTFDMVIIADAPSWQACPNRRPLLSAKHLALRGAAEIHLSADGNSFDPRHSLAGPVRPWLEHRRFSRPARNLPEYRRRPRQ